MNQFKRIYFCVSLSGVSLLFVIQVDHHFLGIDAVGFFFFLVAFFAQSSLRTGAVPNVRAVVLDIYMHCVHGGWRCTGTLPIHTYQLKAARCSSQGFVNASYVTLPTAGIMRYAWIWNCARLLMPCSFRLWVINAIQQVTISPSLVLSVGASGTVRNRQLAF